GWTEVSKAGSLIKRQVSSFDTRNYGFSTLVKLIEALNKTFEVSRTPTGNGKSLMVEYRVMQK
ncbi:MAG: OST-HTH/LOTUS domain-containing protein, partial [Treponema sp.]|nr:OST-HTH/LOTUS domain-containing protein [Treponema sp.]